MNDKVKYYIENRHHLVSLFDLFATLICSTLFLPISPWLIFRTWSKGLDDALDCVVYGGSYREYVSGEYELPHFVALEITTEMVEARNPFWEKRDTVNWQEEGF
jgi:hypothetical protein